MKTLNNFGLHARYDSWADRLDVIFRAGRNAFRSDLPVSENPYSMLRKKEWEAWRKGWYMEAKEAKKRGEKA